MITLLLHVLRVLPFLFGGHRQLAVENLALRQQLAGVFGKSVASTIATSDGPPDPAEPVRDVQSRPSVRLLTAPPPNAPRPSVVARRTCWPPLLSTVS